MVKDKTNNCSLMSLNSRLKKLEKQNQRLKKIGTICLLIVCISLITAAKSVQKKKFLLNDDNGVTRIKLGIIKKQPFLSFMDENGNVRMKLELNNNMPTISFYDEKFNNRIFLGMVDQGPGLGFMNNKGEVKTLFGVLDGNNRPFLDFYNDLGENIWQLAPE